MKKLKQRMSLWKHLKVKKILKKSREKEQKFIFAKLTTSVYRKNMEKKHSIAFVIINKIK